MEMISLHTLTIIVLKVSFKISVLRNATCFGRRVTWKTRCTEGRGKLTKKVFRLPPTLPKGNVTSAFVCNWNPRQAGTAAFAASFVMEYE